MIIGNGAAGIAAADAIRTRNKTATIEIITKEDVPAYYRPSLSDYLTGEISEKDLLELGYGKNQCPTLQQVLPHAKQVLSDIDSL